MLQRYLNRLVSVNTAKNLSVLMGGSLVSSVISILASLITARLFEPAHFGIMALITAGSSILGVIAFSHFPNLIIIEKEDQDVSNALSLSLITHIGICFLAFLSIGFYHVIVSLYFKNVSFQYWLYIVPLLTLLNGIVAILLVWANRNALYKKIAFQRFLQVLIPTILQISIGFFYASASVIIISQIIGILCSTLLLLNMFKEKLLSLVFNKPAFGRMIKQNKALILGSLPADVINNFSNQLPVFFLKKFALNGNAAVGYFNMGNRLFSLPISFLTSSITEIFRQKASKQYHEEGSCRPLLIKTSLTLFLISILPFLVGMAFAPDIFAFVFGEKWRPAGDYARLIGVLFFFKTIVSPISYVVYIARKFYISLIMDIVLFVISIAAIFIGIYGFHSVEMGILFYSISYALLYFITFYLSYKYAVNSNFNSEKTKDHPVKVQLEEFY